LNGTLVPAPSSRLSYNRAYGSVSGKLLKLKADGSEFPKIVEGTFLGVLQ
jgi:hypothetical protein